MLRKGKVVLPKIESWQADEGEWWCTIWYPFSEDDPDVGPCFDFPANDIDVIIALLQRNKEAGRRIE